MSGRISALVLAMTFHLEAPPLTPLTQVPPTAPYGDMPLLFELNRGQTHPHVKFLARGPGYTAFLTATEAVVAGTSGAFRMRLAGANPRATVAADSPVAGVAHYLIGNDPSAWRTNVRQYRRIRYASVYPGIDLFFYGRGRQLEYDIVVAPGADPHLVRLEFDGLRHMEVSGGDLILETSAGPIRQAAPVIYQVFDGARRKVDGAWRRLDERHAGFTISDYDATRPLVIDPVISYSTYLGGSGDDLLQDLAVDSAGNAYITGGTGSTNFPTASAIQTTSRGSDVFVTKLNSSGDGLVFSTYIGGAGVDTGRGIALDPAGNIYITGDTQSMDFPVQSAAQPTPGGGRNVFVAKLNPAGSSIVYSTYLGGAAAEFGLAIAVDPTGAAYVTGYTESTDFPTRTPIQAASRGGQEVFVTKYAPNGSMAYSTYLGGAGGEQGRDIAVDASGSAYVAGITGSNAWPVAGNPFQLARGGGLDAFFCRLAANGASLLFSTYLGDRASDEANGIALDSAGNAYVAGTTQSEDFPTRNAAQDLHNEPGTDDAFAAKFGPAGDLIYSTFLGGSDPDTGAEVTVDASGRATVTGLTESEDFPAVGALQPQRNRDAYLTRFTSDGQIDFSTWFGGGGTEVGYGVAMDGQGNTYLAGTTDSTSLPVAAAFQSRFAGGTRDAFVVKLAGEGGPLSMVSAASFQGAFVAPESIVAGYGRGLAPRLEVAASSALPKVLAGVSVRVRDSAGAEREADLFFVSEGQVNFVVPGGTAEGFARVIVYSEGTPVASGSVEVERVAPGIFTANSNGRGVAAALALRVRADGSQSTELIFQCAAAGNCRTVPIDPGPATDQVFLLLFGTGIRGHSSIALRATIGGESAEVLAAVPQGEFAGLDQVNVRLPRSLSGRGEVNLDLSIDFRTSNVVTVAVGGTPVTPPPPPPGGGNYTPIATGMSWRYRVQFPGPVGLPYQPIVEAPDGLLCSNVFCGTGNVPGTPLDFTIAVGEKLPASPRGEAWRVTMSDVAQDFYFNLRAPTEMRVRDISGESQLEIISTPSTLRLVRPVARIRASDLANRQTVTVPAGTYTDVIRTTLTLIGNGINLRGTFITEVFLAPGVGLIRAVMRDESGRTLFTQELTAFSTSPPPPPPAGQGPRITALSPNTATAGQTLTNFAVNGQDLAAATTVEFAPPGGFTVSNARPTASSVAAQVAIAAGTKIGVRAVSVSAPAGRSNVLPFYLAPDSVAPGVAKIHWVSRRTARPGESIPDWTVFGTNMAGVTGIDFGVPGITLRNLRTTPFSVSGTLDVASSVSSTLGEITLISPAGRSGLYFFEVVGGAGGGPFTVSNLRFGTVRISSTNSIIPVTLDFEDPTGTAGGVLRIFYNFESSAIFGFASANARVTSGTSTKGAIQFDFDFNGQLRSGVNVLVDFTLLNSRGVESNFVVGDLRTP